jgi:hypothetical protein
MGFWGVFCKIYTCFTVQVFDLIEFYSIFDLHVRGLKISPWYRHGQHDIVLMILRNFFLQIRIQQYQFHLESFICLHFWDRSWKILRIFGLFSQILTHVLEGVLYKHKGNRRHLTFSELFFWKWSKLTFSTYERVVIADK